MKQTFYTGVGSRQTPDNICKLISKISHVLDNKGYILRTGDAVGADRAFLKYSGNFECYGFRDAENDNNALKLGEKFHPAWNKLSYYAKHLIARNGYQVLGKDLKTPSSFVICWTPDGATNKTTIHTGGTGQCIRIANYYSIPVFNLNNKKWEGLSSKDIVKAILNSIDTIDSSK